MKGFLLGLTNGGACLAVCLPLFVPYVLSEPRSFIQNLPVLAKFLLGRLSSYWLWAFLAWLAGQVAATNTPARMMLMGLAFLVGSLFLMLYGFREPQAMCTAKKVPNLLTRCSARVPGFMPWLLGCLTGLNLCPPLMLTFAAAADTGTLLGSVGFFTAFFLGTSVYFLPVPFLGALARIQSLRIIGRLAVGVMGFYYLYSGAMMLTKGIAQLKK